MTPKASIAEKYIGVEVGSFRSSKLLGMGGMGAVFLAQHKSVDLCAAIKVLRDPFGDEDNTARFPTEARSLAKLEHPGLVRMHDCGTQASSCIFS